MFEDILALLFGPSAESAAQYERARAAQDQWAKIVAAENFRLAQAQTPSFVCPRCGAESFNPNDIAERYCGRCHVFVDDGLGNPVPHVNRKIVGADWAWKSKKVR